MTYRKQLSGMCLGLVAAALLVSPFFGISTAFGVEEGTDNLGQAETDDGLEEPDIRPGNSIDTGGPPVDEEGDGGETSRTDPDGGETSRTGPGGGGTTGGAVSAATKANIKERSDEIKKLGDDLFAHLLARERARWNFEHGGGFDKDYLRLKLHNDEIRRIQIEQNRKRRAIYNELSASFKGSKKKELDARWARSKDAAQKNRGLPGKKYQNVNEYDAPRDKKERDRWLRYPNYFAP